MWQQNWAQNRVVCPPNFTVFSWLLIAAAPKPKAEHTDLRIYLFLAVSAAVTIIIVCVCFLFNVINCFSSAPVSYFHSPFLSLPFPSLQNQFQFDPALFVRLLAVGPWSWAGHLSSPAVGKKGVMVAEAKGRRAWISLNKSTQIAFPSHFVWMMAF